MTTIDWQEPERLDDGKDPFLYDVKIRGSYGGHLAVGAARIDAREGSAGAAHVRERHGEAALKELRDNIEDRALERAMRRVEKALGVEPSE